MLLHMFTAEASFFIHRGAALINIK